jgi:hypothetical protein
MAEVTAVTESIEEIVAVTMVIGTGTEAAVGAVMTGVTGTGIVVAVAGTTTTIRDTTKTTGAVTTELHVKMTLGSMAGEEAGGKMEASPMVSVVVEAEGDRNKKV